MGILQPPTQLAGTPGVQPNFKYMTTTDSYATITAAGYLNQPSLEVTPVSQGDVIQCLYAVSIPSGSSTYGVFTVSIAAGTGIITLVPWGGDSGVVLPTIANHIAVYTNTIGTIGEDAATAINGGNIQAGLSGTAGYVASFPGTASKGSLRMTAVANTGNTVTTISNDAMGQASTVNIPDPGNAVGQFLVGATATPFVSGNFPKNSGTGGLMVDSGLAVSAIATTSTAVLLAPSGDQTITAHNLTVSQGNLQAGSSGHAGTVTSFPGTAANGSLILAAVNAGANNNMTISNGTLGQSSVVTIPDPGAATANFAVAPAALVNNNLIKASGTAGLVADAGIAVSAVQLNTNIKAQQVSGLGGSGAGPLTVTAAGCTTSSVICVDIVASSNPASVIKVVPGTGNFALTLSADPGATLTISYIMFIAAQ